MEAPPATANTPTTERSLAAQVARSYSCLTEEEREPRQFRCRQCEYVMSSDKEYLTHMAEEHPTSQSLKQLIYCKLCPFVTDSNGLMTYHMRCHERGDSFKCPDCWHLLATARAVLIHRSRYCRRVIAHREGSQLKTAGGIRSGS